MLSFNSKFKLLIEPLMFIFHILIPQQRDDFHTKIKTQLINTTEMQIKQVFCIIKGLDQKNAQTLNS